MKIIVRPIMLFIVSIIATVIWASFVQAQSKVKQESLLSLGTGEGEIAEFEINNFALTSGDTVIIWKRGTPRLAYRNRAQVVRLFSICGNNGNL